MTATEERSDTRAVVEDCRRDATKLFAQGYSQEQTIEYLSRIYVGLGKAGVAAALAVYGPATTPPTPQEPQDMTIQITDNRAEESRTELATSLPTARMRLNQMRTVEIKTTQMHALFVQAMTHVKAELKKYTEREQLITRPQREAIASVQELFHPIKEILKEQEELIKEKLAAYQEFLSLETEAKLATAHEAAARGDAEGAALALASLEEPSHVEGEQVRRLWDFEIKNVSLLPVEYILPNVKAIREEMRRQVKAAREAQVADGVDAEVDEMPVIPGVIFKKVVKIAAVGAGKGTK